jgi:5-methylcytosine-specific restriction endonuclease McrA
MLRLRQAKLPSQAAATLEEYQKAVDATGDYSARVAAAKEHFSKYNTKANTTFATVRVTLNRMCSGARRCCYCEDSMADEVEHIAPKDLFPELVFSWNNYLYACGPCNGPKNNRFAIILADDTIFDITSRPYS